MRISVFGLGYVGCVSAACLAKDKHQVIGVEVAPQKIAMLQSGKSPVIEPGLDELIKDIVADGRLAVTDDTSHAIHNSELSLICVGTPSNNNGSLKTDYVKIVGEQIGKALATKGEYHTVVLRSTVLPGTSRDMFLPTIEAASGKKAGVDFGLCMNPEFLRESTAIKDYYNPSHIVIGEIDQQSGDAVEEMYEAVSAPIVRTSLETAEMLKYANNSFHALKVAYANEIGSVCKAHGVDGREVMEIFCQDRQLNISSGYLRPGFAFGGSCLPKDTRALLYRARERDIETPIIRAVLESNDHHIQNGIRMIEETGKKKVGVLGLSFKSGTDDVRESPIVPLIETLVGRGYQVSVYDELVELSRLIGANKSFLEQEIPHIASLMRASISDVVENADVVVVTNGSAAFKEVPATLRDDQVLIDLVGIDKQNANDQMRDNYEGICW
ncbi:nucleotide sugar dehydrogenase [Planctomycetota bacterium]